MLSAGNQNLGTVDINRGIFQGDSLSPLLFVMIMTPLSMLLNEEKKGYKLGSSGNQQETIRKQEYHTSR